MKVAIVHYWLVGMRGGEKVLEALCEIYPEADIYTHVVDLDNISDTLKKHTIRATFISKLPKAKKWYQKYLPLMPIALEQLNLTQYDLVFSSESGPSKGVITAPGSTHICYCHSPMRYVWDMYYDYLESAGFFTRLMMRPILHYMRIWDFVSAARVDHFIANSKFVASRIDKFYRREAKVIHPPVSVEDFTANETKEDYYLVIGQLVGYKRADLAVSAFNRIGKKLVVIGEGEKYEQLCTMANDNVRILGRQPFSEIKKHYANAKALIFPGVEDFGIVPLEATASATPVIAYAQGGALETIKDGVTGLFFYEQTDEALIDAVQRFESQADQFQTKAMVEWADTFNKARFIDEICQYVNNLNRP